MVKYLNKYEVCQLRMMYKIVWCTSKLNIEGMGKMRGVH